MSKHKADPPPATTTATTTYSEGDGDGRQRQQQQQLEVPLGPENAGDSHAVPGPGGRQAGWAERVLRQHGVHKGQPEKRRALAERLAADDGFTEHVCELLYREYRDVRGDANPGWQLTVALERGFWKELAADIEAEKCRKPGEHDHGETMQREDLARTQMTGEQERRAMWAYEMLLHDGKSPAQTATVLGVSVGEVPKLVRQGMDVYGYSDIDEGARLLLSGARKKFSAWVREHQSKEAVTT